MIDNINWFFEHLEKNEPFAFARFNDGEMMGVERAHTIVARGDQYVDESLRDALREALMHKQKNYYVGVPCSLCYPHLNDLALNIVGKDYEYLTKAVITTNRNWKEFIDRFPKYVGGKRVIWIGGSDQNTDQLTEMGINIFKTVKVPNKNSWNYYKALKHKVPEHFNTGDIVAVSLGPTARVLVKEWFEKYPDITFIDVGSNFDPFTRKVYHNCHKGWEETGFNIGKPCEECN